MQNDKVTISDWIRFLSTHRSQSLTLVLALVAVIIALFIFIGANFSNPNAVQFYIFNAVILAFVLSVVCLILVHYKLSSFKRSFNLLDEIFRDGLNDVEIIRKRWYYPEENNMCRNFLRRNLPNRISIIGFVIAIVAVIIFITGLLFAYFTGHITIQDLIIGLLFSVCIGVISFGVSAIALGISRHSDETATKSDKKVDDIANSNFLNILSKFEDRRIDLQYDPRRARIHPILIWKALIDMREAEELLEFCSIEIKHQTRLINLLNHLLKYVNRDYIEVLNCEEVSHLIQMSLIGLKLNDQLLDKKNEVTNRVATLFNEEQNIEIPNNYLIWMNDVIEREVFKDNFLLMRDQYKEWYWSIHNQ